MESTIFPLFPTKGTKYVINRGRGELFAKGNAANL